MINMPPRLGKSFTLIMFCQWVFGQNVAEKIISCSYNDTEAYDFSRYVRDGISEVSLLPGDTVHSSVFPECQLKEGNAAVEKWALKGRYFSYKAAGIMGGVTGKGGSIVIVDDPVKDVETAYNDLALERIWRWLTGTLLSRMEEGCLFILNMTRWVPGDPCGRIQKATGWKDKWYHFVMEAKNEVGELLCPDLLSEESYTDKQRDMLPQVFRANMHQDPVSVAGRLYKYFKTYGTGKKCNKPEPEEYESIIAYGDVADEGDDFYCLPIAGVFKGELYLIDVIYTQKGMEVTEPQTAEKLKEYKVQRAKFESQSGGKGFARSVERIMREELGWVKIAMTWFHQSKNKLSRIRTAATYVMSHIYFPEDWNLKHPGFYEAMVNYQVIGKNRHDDAPDGITGLYEMIEFTLAKKDTKRVTAKAVGIF